jgi:hypothetical protein
MQGLIFQWGDPTIHPDPDNPGSKILDVKNNLT